jgi:putative Mg2+ transporter-C (MgtC) family protein
MSLVHWTAQAQLCANLGLSVVLGAAVGAERQLRAKSAGIRTHALVALGAATFVLVSKFGFDDLAGKASISIDPTRVAAQVVSGIGFLGAGLIFLRRNSVRGLTTAASVWLSAAIGMAAGAGIFLVAITATALHFAVVVIMPHVTGERLGMRRLESTIRLAYPDGKGSLREILEALTHDGWAVTNFDVHGRPDPLTGRVTIAVQIAGRGSPEQAACRLAELTDVLSVDLEPDA